MSDLDERRDEARVRAMDLLFEARHAIIAYMALAPDDSAAHAAFADVNMAVIHLRASQTEMSYARDVEAEQS